MENELTKIDKTSPPGNTTDCSHIIDPFQELAQVFEGGLFLDDDSIMGRFSNIIKEIEDSLPVEKSLEKTVTEEKDISKEEVEAKELIDQLRKGKKLHEEFSKNFNSLYKIAGKLMSEWKQYFKVKIPSDLNPQTCLSIGSKIIGFYQEASFLKAEAEARLAAYKSATDDKYRTRYAELVTEYKAESKKIPAKDTLAELASYDIGDIKNALVHSEIELAFWKEMLNNLNHARKTIENATIGLGIEAKALQSEKYIDSLNKKYND